MRLKIQTLLEDAEQCTGRIASLVEAVRSIARQERAELADIDVHEQIRSALGVLDHKLKNVRVAQNFSSECGHVRGYPSELAQVWVNLLDNAADAVNGGGEIAIQTRRDDNQTVVEIVDNGPGIPPENLSHIFEPFFTTKGVGSGKGLGLTISQGIVGDRHGGEIEVESKAGETRFIVRLPVRRIERNEGAEAIVATRAYMAELTEQLEEMESVPPPQTPTVSEGGFATVFDVPLFAQLDESQRECLSTGTEVRFARGEIVLREGDPSNFFHVMLEGELRVTNSSANRKFSSRRGFRETSSARFQSCWTSRILCSFGWSPTAGFFACHAPNSGTCYAPRLRWRREIMRTLATRLRNMEGYTQEREKLIQLGAMAAGLAHELNNPATAARRAATDLRQSVDRLRTTRASLTNRSAPRSGDNWLRPPKRPCIAPRRSRNSIPSNKATVRKRSNAGSIRAVSRNRGTSRPRL